MFSLGVGLGAIAMAVTIAVNLRFDWLDRNLDGSIDIGSLLVAAVFGASLLCGLSVVATAIL